MDLYYPKINSLWKRDERGAPLPNTWAMEEFEYLKDNQWVATEKVDGTNIRVWIENGIIMVGGRRAASQIPAHFSIQLSLDLPPDVFIPAIEKVFGTTEDIMFFGEGYGSKIQQAGNLYDPDRTHFIIFDIYAGGWWLRRDDVVDVVKQLNDIAAENSNAFVLFTTPNVATGTLVELCNIVAARPKSFCQRADLANLPMEGIVARPATELFTRRGERITVKIKYKDFQQNPDLLTAMENI